MNAGYFVDALAIPLVFVLVVAALLLDFLAGHRLGRLSRNWRRAGTAGDDPGGQLVNSLLGLMAFLIAITVGMAGDRFETRSSLVVEEANAIRVMSREASLLPAPAGEKIQAYLREYVPLRIDASEHRASGATLRRSRQIVDELWDVVRALPAGAAAAAAALTADLNAVENVLARQTHSIRNERVPEELVVVLFTGTLLAMLVLAFHAGQAGRPNQVGTGVLVVVLSVVLTLVIDLDRPRDGLLHVNQTPLEDVVARTR